MNDKEMMTALIASLREVWKDRLERKINYKGTLAVNVVSRMGAFRDLEGNVTEYQAVSDKAISRMLRAAGGKVGNDDIITHRVTRLDNGPHQYLENVGIPLDTEIRENFPRLGALTKATDLDAALSWKAADVAYRALRTAQEPLEAALSYSGRLRPLHKEIEAVLEDAETTVHPRELAEDDAYQIALRTKALLYGVISDFEWSYYARYWRTEHNIRQVYVAYLERQLFLADQEGAEERIDGLVEDLNEELRIMGLIMKEVGNSEFATALALA